MGKDLKSSPESLKGGSWQLRLLARSCSVVNEDCSRTALVLKEKREAPAKELLDEQQNFNTRLAALNERYWYGTMAIRHAQVVVTGTGD